MSATIPYQELQGDAFDVAFVGSGLAASFTTIRLVGRLLEAPPPRPVRIVHIERSGEFYTGIAYGKRSGTASLIITPLDEFLPAAEIPAFVAWMRGNASSLLDELRAYGGLRSEQWHERAERAVKDGACNGFHIPRFFYGRYLTERVNTLLEMGRERGVVEAFLVAAEATRLERRDGGYVLDLASPDGSPGEGKLTSKLVVVAIGMPPTKRLFDGENAAEANALLIDDPYEPGMDQTLERIAAHVARTDERPEILVIGANAGCLELLYGLTNVRAIDVKAPKVHVLSPQGRLPERYRALAEPRFVPTNLQALASQPSVKATLVVEAAKHDVAAAKREGVSISDSLPMISRAVGALLPLLDAAERRAFAAFAGVEIGRLQRRAGDEYCDAADALVDQDRLSVVAGRYGGVTPAPNGVVVWYEDATTKHPISFARPMSVVVNCSGPSAMAVPSASRFIDSVLKMGVFRATDAAGGLAVGDGMEATRGLYVNGPLLSGNIVADRPVWHVEHCGRIIQFSTLLAGHLAARLTEDLDRNRHAG